MTDDAVTVIDQQQTAILAYGGRDDVREIATRLMALHPAAKEVGERGMQAVAQLAIMAGANPMPGAGEIYVWMDSKGMIVVFLGVAYYRRIASQKDTLMWAFNGGQPRPMTPAEREERGIPEGAVAAICEGLKLSEYEKLLGAGVPWEAAQQMLKRTSYATVGQQEMVYQRNTKYRTAGDPVDPPHGRTWQWVAEKRAEIGIYRLMSLVDTTLTDAMQERVKQVLGHVDRAEGPPKSQPEDGWNSHAPHEIDDMFSYG